MGCTSLAKAVIVTKTSKQIAIMIYNSDTGNSGTFSAVWFPSRYNKVKHVKNDEICFQLDVV